MIFRRRQTAVWGDIHRKTHRSPEMYVDRDGSEKSRLFCQNSFNEQLDCRIYVHFLVEQSCSCLFIICLSHHQSQPGLRKPGQVVEQNVESLARQIQWNQLVRVGDVLGTSQLCGGRSDLAVLQSISVISLIKAISKCSIWLTHHVYFVLIVILCPIQSPVVTYICNCRTNIGKFWNRIIWSFLACISYWNLKRSRTWMSRRGVLELSSWDMTAGWVWLGFYICQGKTLSFWCLWKEDVWYVRTKGKFKV